MKKVRLKRHPQVYEFTKVEFVLGIKPTGYTILLLRLPSYNFRVLCYLKVL